jgi:hypothetical protein
LGQNISCIITCFRQFWRSKMDHHVLVVPFGYSPLSKNYRKSIHIKYCPWKCTNRVNTWSLVCDYSPWCVPNLIWFTGLTVPPYMEPTNSRRGLVLLLVLLYFYKHIIFLPYYLVVTVQIGRF